MSELLDELRSDIAPTNPDGPLDGDVVLYVTYGVARVERIIAELERAERLEAKLRELDDAGTDGLEPGSVLWVALMGIEEVLES